MPSLRAQSAKSSVPASAERTTNARCNSDVWIEPTEERAVMSSTFRLFLGAGPPVLGPVLALGVIFLSRFVDLMPVIDSPFVVLWPRNQAYIEALRQNGIDEIWIAVVVLSTPITTLICLIWIVTLLWPSVKFYPVKPIPRIACVLMCPLSIYVTITINFNHNSALGALDLNRPIWISVLLLNCCIGGGIWFCGIWLWAEIKKQVI